MSSGCDVVDESGVSFPCCRRLLFILPSHTSVDSSCHFASLIPLSARAERARAESQSSLPCSLSLLFRAIEVRRKVCCVALGRERGDRNRAELGLQDTSG